MRIFLHNLAQINIESKVCHPVQKISEQKGFFCFFLFQAWKKKEERKKSAEKTQQDNKGKEINLFYIPLNISHRPGAGAGR